MNSPADADVISFDGVRFISAADAGKESGFVRDYITRLARTGKIRGRQIGGKWYIEYPALQQFAVTNEHERSIRWDKIAEQRRRERALAESDTPADPDADAPASPSTEFSAQPIVLASASPRQNEDRAHAALATAFASGSSLLTTRVPSAPAGISDAMLQSAHVPTYALTPFVEFLHKVVALTLSLALVLGTYAAVDPQYAHFAAQSAQDEVASAVDSYKQATGGGIGELAQRSQLQVAVVAENPQLAASAVAGAFTNSLPAFAAGIARAVNTDVNNFVYAVAFPVNLVRSLGVVRTGATGSVAVEVLPYASTSLTASQSGSTKANPGPSIAGPRTVINQPVIERVLTTDRVVTEGGISEAELDQKLNELSNKLTAQLYSVSSSAPTPPASGGITNTIALTNRVDQLSGTTITNATISGGTISGVALSASDLSGVVAIAKGGTGTTTAPVYGQLLVGNATGGYSLLATSSLGIVGGSDTQIQFNSNGAFGGDSTFTFSTSTKQLGATGAVFTNATTTNATSTNLFATTASSTNLFSQTASLGTLTLVNALTVANGGTGSTTLSGILKGNGTGVLKTAVGGTDYEFPLTFSTGLNRSGNTITNTGVLSLGSGYATSTGTSIAFSTTTQSFNGLTIAQNITASAGALTLAPNISGTLNNAGLTNSTISGVSLGSNLASLAAGDGTLTFSGSYNGGTARIVNLNLGNANTWTALQQFSNASSSLLSVTSKAYFGGTATTIDSGGNVVIPSTATLTVANLSGAVSASAGVLSAGTLTIANGGTGTTTQVTNGVNYFDGTRITSNPSLLSFTGTNFGVGTSTPWARLSIDTSSLAAGVPEFAVGSSTRSDFVINQSGNVGIGKNNPGSALDVNGTVSATSFSGAGTSLTGTGASFTAGAANSVTFNGGLTTASIPTFAGLALTGDITTYRSGAPTTGVIFFGNSGVRYLYYDGANYNLPGAGLTLGGSITVNGDLIVNPAYVFRAAYAFASPLYDVNNTAYYLDPNNTSGFNNILYWTLTSRSDQRLKTNIQTLDATSGLATIDALNPVTFNWVAGAGGTNTAVSTSTQYGFIAQQVQKVLPALVTVNGTTTLTPDGTLFLNYNGLIAPMVKSIQELDARIETIASTSAATTTPDALSFAQSFWVSIKSQITQWLANASNGIDQFFANVGNFHTVNTDKLCVNKSDGTRVCVTGDQLAAILSGQTASAAASQTVGGNSSSNSSSTPTTISTSTTPTTASDAAPVISINGNNPATVKVGDSYADLGATITGPQADLKLGIKTFLNGTLTSNIMIDTTQVATDTIDYVATDTWDNTATSTRTVIVEASASAPTNDASTTPPASPPAPTSATTTATTTTP
jgi:hypothetical protein